MATRKAKEGWFISRVAKVWQNKQNKKNWVKWSCHHLSDLHESMYWVEKATTDNLLLIKDMLFLNNLQQLFVLLPLGLWSCFSAQRDSGPWLNEGLHCKQHAVGADWRILPPHTFPLASDTLLQSDSISAGQCARTHPLCDSHSWAERTKLYFQKLKLEIHE